MTNHRRIPVLTGDSKDPFAEILNSQADLFKRFFGKAARDRGNTALIRAKSIVDFAADLQILQMIFAEDGRTAARRGGYQRLTDRLFPIGIPMDESILL